ncbi:MAG: hypothetical protein LBS62_05975 [Clostridiales bacterium]|jgi:pyruvate-formate lyase|nr:hypothetical protein [Clostridiales bacterium]
MNREETLKELEYALRFTEVYQSESDIYKREAQCLKLQTPHILAPIIEGDLIAGRVRHGFVGFSPQFGGLYTYFYHEDKAAETLASLNGRVPPELESTVKQMDQFWRREKTLNRLWERFRGKFPDAQIYDSYTKPGIANTDGRLAGTNVDLYKLVRKGVPGLLAEIKGQGGGPFYEALAVAAETIADACRFYEEQAIALEKTAQGAWKRDLAEMIQNLRNLQVQAPSNFKEGLQLIWIYAVVSDLMNFGRMDAILGDLYAKDLEEGSIDEEEGIRWLTSLYRQFLRLHKIHDTRVIIGGKGRANERNADKLALAFMETSRRFKDVVPQLTLRYYKGMSEEVYDKAIRVNAEGTTFPIIYSDETNIPAVMSVYGVDESEAERYLPFGCGEYVLEGLSVGTPNCGINLLKALELTLQRGYDYYWRQRSGIDTGDLTQLDGFEKLWDAYVRQLQPWLTWVAWHNKINHDVAAEQAGYLHISLLMDDCLARGKGVLNGGVRYFNAAAEVFGIISCADSLTAIKTLVYEQRAFSLSELAEMLRNNFAGHERERQKLLKAPKYGNDDDAADAMAVRVFSHVAEAVMDLGQSVGFNKYNIVSVNNSMSAEWGQYCIASPCGRKAGAPMSNGNGPSLGADKNGVTALLNSMAKFDPATHVGVINNVRFTKELARSSFAKIKEALRVFYEHNGVQTNLCFVGREDLENAMAHPEDYQNLIVRVGGFSARFVELAPVIQNELILRTSYDS